MNGLAGSEKRPGSAIDSLVQALETVLPRLHKAEMRLAGAIHRLSGDQMLDQDEKEEAVALVKGAIPLMQEKISTVHQITERLETLVTKLEDYA